MREGAPGRFGMWLIDEALFPEETGSCGCSGRLVSMPVDASSGLWWFGIESPLQPTFCDQPRRPDQRSLRNSSMVSPASRTIAAMVMAFTGSCRGIVILRTPFVMTMCLPCRKIQKPAFSKPRTAGDGQPRAASARLSPNLDFFNLGTLKLPCLGVQILPNGIGNVRQRFFSGRPL